MTERNRNRMKNLRLLMISNGHGEDLLGALLARHLLYEMPQWQLHAYPVVGYGGAYERAGIERVGVQQSMPTGGFILKGPGNLWKDLRAGLIDLTRRQIRDLKKRRDHIDAVIAMGDIYVLLLAGRYVKRPLIFVPTAKSEYIQGHFGWEYALMKRRALAVFPRDERTDEAMKQRGVRSSFVGNLMMDALDVTGTRFGLDAERPIVALLPGSRVDAYENSVDLLQVAHLAAQKQPGMQFVLSVAPDLDGDALRRTMPASWRWMENGPPLENDTTTKGLFGRLFHQDGSCHVLCVHGMFGDVLHCSDLVVGLAGTGNEQAAGLGKPVVAFPGRGTQFTRKFAHDQKRLLGPALSLMPHDPEQVAEEVVRILNDPSRYEAMGAAGRKRMGPPGGARRMAREVIRVLAEANIP